MSKYTTQAHRDNYRLFEVRNRMIYKQYVNRTKAAALAKKYSLSHSRIYQIIRKGDLGLLNRYGRSSEF